MKAFGASTIRRALWARRKGGGPYVPPPDPPYSITRIHAQAPLSRTVVSATVTDLPAENGFRPSRIASGGANWHRVQTVGSAVTAGVLYHWRVRFRGGTSGKAYLEFKDGGTSAIIQGNAGALAITNPGGGGTVLTITEQVLVGGDYEIRGTWTPGTSTVGGNLGVGPFTTTAGQYLDLLGMQLLTTTDDDGFDPWLFGGPVGAFTASVGPDDIPYLVNIDGAPYAHVSYQVYSSPWGKGALVQGVDYENRIDIKPNSFPKDIQFTADWRVTTANIKGYNHVSWGDYDGATLPTPVPSRTIAQILGGTGAFSAYVDCSRAGGVDDGDVLLEFYTTTAAGGGSAKSSEIGWHLTAGPTTRSYFASLTTQHGNFTDSSGRTWECAEEAGGSAGRFIQFLPPVGVTVEEGTFNFKEFLAFLNGKGLLNTAHFINGFALGLEPRRGLTFLTVNDFACLSWSA